MAAMAAGIALPASLALIVAWLWGAQAFNAQEARRVEDATRSLANSIEDRLALDLAHLKTLASLPVMQDVLIADSGREIARFVQAFVKQHREFAHLRVTAARGGVIASASNDETFKPVDDEEGFRAAASGRVHQGPLTVSEGPAAFTISYKLPLIAAYDRQNVIGTLSAVIDIGWIAQNLRMQSALAGKDNAVVIVRGQDGRAGFATHSEGAIEAAASVEGGVENITWRGAPHFAAQASSTGKGLVRNPEFVVRSIMPAGEAYAAADQLLAIAGAAAAIAAAAALALMWRWATPLVTIATAMERLARGSDPDRALPVAASHTFGPMARAFESLRQAKAVQAFLSGRERELVRKKEDAENALHEKSEHLASLTRALKEQLTSIVELSEAINAEALNAVMGNNRASLAKDISRSGTQLLTVINDLFELSEAEAGHTTLKESEVELGALVGECVELMRDAFQKANVIAACILPDEPLTATVDAQKIRQVMFNLLSNAIKFTPEQGRVEVAVRVNASGCASIIIADTGIGMPANLPPMAAPFGASAQANNHGRHGAGLGLPLARQLIDMHDGALEIESEPNKGTVVTVTLPARRVSCAQEQEDRRLSA